MAGDSTFVDLRRLAAWFEASAGRPSWHVERLVQRIGAACVPLLGRELVAVDPRRREAARALLAALADAEARGRVIDELRRIAASDALDDAKVAALGLLAELGERGAARFADPLAIQKRSALALAAQLETASDIAEAADMMSRQLGDAEMVQLLEVMGAAAPAAARALGGELCVRLDVAIELRERIADLIAQLPVMQAPASATGPAPARRPPRPSHARVLVDAAARLVVVTWRKLSGERRWRRWAVLIDVAGRIEDCLHELCEEDAATLIDRLVADGYRLASEDVDRARTLVAAAARHSAGAHDAHERLGSAYYLGRDLLDLGDAHLGPAAHPASTALGRAVDLIAAKQPARAQTLLARCDPASPDVAAAQAACLLARGEPGEAIGHLVRAIEAEPEFPLHHWNLAAAARAIGDRATAHQALRRFVATSARPSGLYGDPDQPARVVQAERMIAELERTARLAGTPLARPRRKRRAAKRL